MKDKQVAPALAEPRIFLLSGLLHCVSMTALVYLRSSFGFAYLGSKSVFFALSWAFVLYAVYAWMDGFAWQDHHAVIFFGAGAAILYWVHLLIAVFREWQQTGEHDQYSGSSHAIWLLRKVNRTPSPRFEASFHLWVEPVAVLITAGVVSLTLTAPALSMWLLIVALCLWTKEALNHWHRLRQQKRHKDVFEDTAETVGLPLSNKSTSEPPKATRKAKISRSRNAA